MSVLKPGIFCIRGQIKLEPRKDWCSLAIRVYFKCSQEHPRLEKRSAFPFTAGQQEWRFTTSFLSWRGTACLSITKNTYLIKFKSTEEENSAILIQSCQDTSRYLVKKLFCSGLRMWDLFHTKICNSSSRLLGLIFNCAVWCFCFPANRWFYYHEYKHFRPSSWNATRLPYPWVWRHRYQGWACSSNAKYTNSASTSKLSGQCRDTAIYSNDR